ncbi:hypothetical protein [Sphingomonas lenta]|nr:hypothetical protein [Sphingomonas lenta]
MVWLAIAMFIALFAFGGRYFGWDDPQGNIQLAIFSAFVFGTISGYKART